MQQPLFPGADDTWSVSANAKRYSRAEMARVLRERNEFKEKYHTVNEELKELQLRLEKEEKKPKKKEKVSLWTLFAQFFSRKSPVTPRRGSKKKPDAMRMNTIVKDITFGKLVVVMVMRILELMWQDSCAF